MPTHPRLVGARPQTLPGSPSQTPWRRRVTAGALVLVAMALPVGATVIPDGLPQITSTIDGATAARAAEPELPAGLSATDWAALRTQVESSAYRAVADGEGGFQAKSPAQGWAVAYRPDGTTRLGSGAGWSLRLRGYGYGTLVPVDRPRAITAEQATVTYSWDATLSEWWHNTPSGLEQGFTLASPPAGGDGAQPLRLELTWQGPFVAAATADGARFSRADGSAAFTYAGLVTWDARGRTLPTRLEVAGATLTLLVDDAGAVYPLTVDPWVQQAYLKASNTKANYNFGLSVAISGDTVVVGSPGESSNATGVDGNQADSSAPAAGAAYVFVRSGTTWVQQAYLKASNTDINDSFGYSVAISGDTVVVGAFREASNATGIDGNQADNSAFERGAAYVFVRNGTTWSQQAYLKASAFNIGPLSFDNFGYSVAISGDTVVVGARGESSNATGIDGNQADISAPFAGAAYVFVRSGTTWSQQSYLKASNTDASDFFGGSVAISGDTVVVGAFLEASNATGINSDQADNSAASAGAAYVFARGGTTWSQQAYLKASNTDGDDSFGASVAISGNTVVVGANCEASNATGVDGNQADNSAMKAGAAYVFARSGTTWSQQAYLKASNTDASDEFGRSVAVSGDTVVVGANGEDSNATGIDGNQADNSAGSAGAAYVFARMGTTWSRQAYLKASNTGANDQFGYSVAISGSTALVGAFVEASNATGVDGNQADDSELGAGAVYVFAPPTADLSITKTDGVTTAAPGGSLTYTIAASNAGPDDALAATVDDAFPPELLCTWTCVGAGGGSCTTSGSGDLHDTVSLPVGGSVTYTASCTISLAATGTLSNTATVTAGGVSDPAPANNSATDSDTLAPRADLAITNTDGVTTATPGGSVFYTITAANAGPSHAPGTLVSDSFPPSLTCSWICTGSLGGACAGFGFGDIADTVDLPAGASVTYDAFCSVAANASGLLLNLATVTPAAGITDPTSANNSALDVDGLARVADLAVSLTDGVTTAIPGGSVTYAITAFNGGPSDAPGSTVTDIFPASLTCSWSCTGSGGGTCTASGAGNIADTVSLPVGASVTYVAGCTIAASATGSLVDTVIVSGPGGASDPMPANNSASDVDTLIAADLAITNSDGTTAATPGGSLTYTITASNGGSSAAPASTVVDTFPAVLTGCTWTCTGAGGGTCTAAGAGNIADTVNLPVGGSVTYSATCTVAPSASGLVTNTATVSPPANVGDPVPANNSATDIDTLPSIFSDDFESGGTSRWGDQVPAGLVAWKALGVDNSAEVGFEYDVSILAALADLAPSPLAIASDATGGEVFAIEARLEGGAQVLELRLVASDDGLRSASG